MEDFLKKYRRLCDDTGLTTENMAKLLNVGMACAEGLETGYIEPTAEMLMRLASIFNVSEAYMADFTDDPKCHEDDDAKEVFVVDSLRGSNGIIMKSNIKGIAYMDKKEARGKDYYATIMKDDSMAKARMNKGDILIVQRQSAVSNGEVVVAIVEDEEIVRRYHRMGNIVTLTAEGDSFKYKTLKIDERETKFKVLGVVREVRIKNI